MNEWDGDGDGCDLLFFFNACTHARTLLGFKG